MRLVIFFSLATLLFLALVLGFYSAYRYFWFFGTANLATPPQKIDPRAAVEEYNLSKQCFTGHDYWQALVHIKNAECLLQGRRAPILMREILLQKAICLVAYDKTNTTMAVELVDGLLRSGNLNSQTMVHVYAVKAWMFYRVGLLNEAEELLAYCTNNSSVSPRMAHLMVSLAAVYFKSGRAPEAIQSLRVSRTIFEYFEDYGSLELVDQVLKTYSQDK